MEQTRASLLVRAQAGDQDAWTDLTTLYRPLIVGWLRRQGLPQQAVDDLVQDILLCVVQSLPSFSHSGRVGAFRSWLRTIACNRTRDYWRAGERQVAADGEGALRQLEDPDSDLNRQWDEEHDRYILRCLLDAVGQEFEPTTLTAFRRLALEGAPGTVVAEELGVSPGAAYVAKFRVLQRIRQVAEGLID